MNSYSFILEAYNGNGGFENGNHLDKFPRESEDKYKQRQKIAYYTNQFVSKVNRYNGYLFKVAPLRMSNNQLIRQIFNNVDNCGNSIDVFMSSFAKKSKALGFNLLLIDVSKEIPQTLKEQIDNRVLPYFVEITPDRIISYKLDKYNSIEFIAFSDTVDNSSYKKREITNMIRYYDKNMWVIYDDNDNIIDSGEHNLGMCPVLAFSENGNFNTLGEFSQIASLAKKHYNLKSELDEILRSQTFSILTINADTDDDVEMKLGTDNAIKYATGMTPPAYIAPNSASADIYQKEIQTIEDTINKIAYDLTTSQSIESGIALDIKFQGLNSSLSNFAMRLQDLELRALELICKYLDIKNDITIAYPKTFNIVDVQKEINILNEIKSLGYTLPKYEQLKLMQIIINDLGHIGIEEMDIINSEISDLSKE